MKILTKIKNFQSFPASKRRAFIKALPVLLVSRIILNLVPFKRILRHFDNFPAVKPDTKGLRELIEETRWAVQAAGKLVLGESPCLPQALTFLYFLRKHSIPVELKIGVQKDPKDIFSAHAWVELNGETLLGEKTEENYVEIFAA